MSYTTNGGTVTIAPDGSATWSGAAPSFIGGQPVWAPPRNPDAPVQGSERAQLNVAAFGDGYKQRRPKGLNHIEMAAAIAFSNINPAEKELIVGFLRARGGFEPFWWQQPGDACRRWVAPTWGAEQVGFNRWRVTVQMERDHTPVASA